MSSDVMYIANSKHTCILPVMHIASHGNASGYVYIHVCTYTYIVLHNSNIKSQSSYQLLFTSYTKVIYKFMYVFSSH